MARKTLDEKELALKERERTINALEQKYKDQEAKIKKDHEAFLNEKAKFLSGQDEDILKKKKEYEEYVSKINQREKELQKLLSDIEDLKRNKDIELGDYETKKIQSIEKKYRDLMEQNIALIQKSYEEQNAALTENLKFNSSELDSSFKKMLKEYEKELSSKQLLVDKRIEDLKQATEDLEKEAAKYSNLEEREQKIQLQENRGKNKKIRFFN